MHQSYRVGTELNDWARRLLDHPADLLWQTWDETGMLNTMKEHGYTEDDVARWYVDR